MCLYSSAPDIQSPDQGTNTEPGHQPDNIRRKSFLLSRIFSKPPGKDQDDTDESDTGNNTPDNDKDESFVDQKKVRRKKQVELPQNTSSKRPSRNATKNVSLKEASSDSESGESGQSQPSNTGDKETKSKDVSKVRGNTTIVCTSCHK